MKRFLYFAYGSNLHKEQMKRRCPKARDIGVAFLKGYELEFLGSSSKSFGVANVKENKEETVPGALWSITVECLESLDRYEGYPHLYGRQFIDVEDVNKAKRKALIYIMQPGYKTSMPHPEYLHTIANGYKDFSMKNEDYKKLIEAVLKTDRIVKDKVV